jgi:hypothetical protein
MKYFLLTFFSFALLFAACKKYDDGPAFSLESKKKRVSNVWVIQKVYETPQGGTKTDKTADYWSYYYGYIMSLEKDGGYTITYNPMNVSTYNESGIWSFNDKKTIISFASANGNPSAIGTHWTILRLKEKELWMQTINSNNVTIEAHFSPF